MPKRQHIDPGEQLLRSIAADPTAGPWSTWAKKLLRGDPPARSAGDRPAKRRRRAKSKARG